MFAHLIHGVVKGFELAKACIKAVKTGHNTRTLHRFTKQGDQEEKERKEEPLFKAHLPKPWTGERVIRLGVKCVLAAAVIGTGFALGGPIGAGIGAGVVAVEIGAEIIAHRVRHRREDAQRAIYESLMERKQCLVQGHTPPPFPFLQKPPSLHGAKIAKRVCQIVDSVATIVAGNLLLGPFGLLAAVPVIGTQLAVDHLKDARQKQRDARIHEATEALRVEIAQLEQRSMKVPMADNARSFVHSLTAPALQRMVMR